MNEVLAAWNREDPGEAVEAILPCCGSRAWAERVVGGHPYLDEGALFAAADEAWWACGAEDWLQAFACHPRIGERATREEIGAVGSATFATWSEQEQSRARDASDTVQRELADGNRGYERRFGFTYIVCATGRSAEEMLAILRHRLGNEPSVEIREAAEQQRQITQIRLRKWLHG